jgi:hypothetical protein
MESTIPISELLARLTQQSDQVYFIFDPQQTRFLYLTDAFRHIWEFSPERILEDLSPEVHSSR